MKNCELISKHVGSLKKNIQQFKKEYSKIWHETPTAPPQFDRRYSAKEQKNSQKQISDLIDDISLRLKEYPEDKQLQQKWRDEFVEYLHSSGNKIPEMTGTCLETVLSKDFFQSTHVFIDEVRIFEKKQKLSDVYQALRNLWIVNTLQLYLGETVQCNPAVFAYCMLYPYTDNINDDTSLSRTQKHSFNRKLKSWLEGTESVFDGDYERKVYSLTKYIEKHYSRSALPEVYQSLLAIYNAQVRSLTQQTGVNVISERDVLDVSFEKGGTSVLADGFLINGSLEYYQQFFCFGFGAFLQLSDDLQDVETDKNNVHLTLFSMKAGTEDLDKRTNKLMNFITSVTEINLNNGQQINEKLKELIQKNCFLLNMEAIARNSRYFSKKYVKHIEQFCPLGFEFLSRLRSDLQNRVLQIKNHNVSLEMISALLLTQTTQCVNECETAIN